jgi:hypothetical protein
MVTLYYVRVRIGMYKIGKINKTKLLQNASMGHGYGVSTTKVHKHRYLKRVNKYTELRKACED